MAAALIKGHLGVEAFTEANIHNPALLSLAENIHCTPDPHAAMIGLYGV
jgi:2-methylcitrate dehydratase PrpD